MSDLIFGKTWQEIQDLQNKKSKPKKIDINNTGDYGCDPIGNGMFRMVPSGDIVDTNERNKRLKR